MIPVKDVLDVLSADQVGSTHQLWGAPFLTFRLTVSPSGSDTARRSAHDGRFAIKP